MPANPKDSKWYSTPNKLRKRKRLEVTLSEETLADLELLGQKYGSKSHAIEFGIELLKEKDAKRKRS